MTKNKFLPWLNILAAAAALTVNILANALPINGKNTGAISDQFRVLFVPAGYVFAIWGVIYLGWIGFVIYQALPAQQSSLRLQRIGYWFIVSCAANGLWLFLWHYEQFVYTLFVMLTLLAALIVIYLRLGIGRTPVSTVEKWLVDVPFSLYLGWVSVATIANVTDVLYVSGWNGGGLDPAVWAVILLATGTVLAGLMLFRHRDITFGLVIVWSFAGISVKQAAVPLVATAAWITAVIVLGMLVATLFPKIRPGK